jgi:hypothetical protein
MRSGMMRGALPDKIDLRYRISAGNEAKPFGGSISSGVLAGSVAIEAPPRSRSMPGALAMRPNKGCARRRLAFGRFA